jgi:hypothetical protein
MKKIIYFVIILIYVFSPIFVFADEYKTMQLIPVDTNATVSTEKFTYQDFSYRSSLDGNGNAIINFNSIANNTISKIPISINLLLFDQDQKNIGIVTYCTNKDYGNNYEGFKLDGNQAAPFSIKVVSNKYFIEGKGPGDVKYIAVMDDNKYCKVGGYSNYKGLTIDEISNGVSTKEKGFLNLTQYIEDFKESGIIAIIIPIAIVLIIFIVYGMILNALNKAMYSKSTILAYIPIGNVFITFKLAFGKIVAFIGLGLYVFSGVFVLLGINIINYIVTFLDFIAFIVVLIKLITKKYDLFYLEPEIKVNTLEEKESNENSYLSDYSQKTLDLSYENADDVSLGNINDANTFNISSGDSSSNESLEEDNTENSIDDDDSNNNGDGGSDLTSFFE